jgi:hypothetical protein
LGWGSHSWDGEAILGLGSHFLGGRAISWEEEPNSWEEESISWVEELLLGSKSYFLGRTAFHLPFLFIASLYFQNDITTSSPTMAGIA